MNSLNKKNLQVFFSKETTGIKKEQDQRLHKNILTILQYFDQDYFVVTNPSSIE